MDNTKTVSAKEKGRPHEIIEGLTSIVMPVYIYDYSLLHYTGNTIGSIHEHTNEDETPYEIVVVDNGSTIELKAPSEYNCDKYIRNEKNLGVSKAWNQGIRVSQGEFICLMNNDLMVFDNWLPDMLSCLKHLDLVMATPMYGEPFARAVEAQKKREAAHKLGDSLKDTFSDFIDFSCVLTRRSVFDKLGLFDEEMFNYASDSDFLKRMDDAGMNYASTKLVPTFHIIGATTTGMPENPEQMNEDKRAYEEKRGKEVSVVNNDEPRQSFGKSEPTFGKGQDQGEKKIGHPPHPDPSPSVEDNEEVEEDYSIENMPPLVRTTETGDKVYLVDGKKVHWITKPDVMEELGYELGQEKKVDRELFSQFERGEPVTMDNAERWKINDQDLQSSRHSTAGTSKDESSSTGQQKA